MLNYEEELKKFKPCLDVDEVAEDFRKAGCREVYAQADPAQAFEQAYAMKGDGMLFCVGSLYLAGELKDHISKRAKEEKNAQL